MAFVVAATLAAPPALAASAKPGPIAAAAASKVDAMPAGALAQATQTKAATADTAGKPFFKSTKGVVAAILIAGALGYTAYSLSNDRVKSPIR